MITHSTIRRPLCLLGAFVCVLAATAREMPVVAPESAGMSSAKLAKVDAAVESLVQQKRLAGATVMIARHGKTVYFKTFGSQEVAANKPMQRDTIFAFTR